MNTQRHCTIHGVVSPNSDGSCPYCYSRPPIDLLTPGMALLNNTYQGMENMDRRETKETRLPIPPEYHVETSHQCCHACFLCGCCIFLLLPAAIFYAFPPLNQNEFLQNNFVQYGIIAITSIALLIVLWWWWRVKKSGGITTIEEDRNCNCSSYEYLKESGGCCFGVCANIKRLNHSSGCETPRFLGTSLFLIFVFVLGVLGLLHIKTPIN